MSIRTIQSSGLLPRHTAWAGKNTGGSITDTTKPWVRNPSWLTLPTVGDTDQKFVGLVAVFPESSFLALTAAGAYTIDWGDGVVENIATEAQASHLYDFNDADLDGTNAPVTLTDSGDLVTRTAHGYSDGMEVRFYNIVTTTGLIEGQVYYVINATANTFQVSATVGGAAIALTGDGSATLLPYKQAIVTVTPQAGQNLTALNLNVKHSQTGLQTYDAGWLDITVGSPNFTTSDLVLAANSSTRNVRFSYVEQVTVKNLGNTTDLSYRFYYMNKLRSVSLASTAAVTNMSNMFQNCSSLQTVPPFNVTAVILTTSMFYNCYSLARIQAKNFRINFAVFNCKLSATALNEIYTNLPTVTGQTITVTGNYGTATDNPTIATAKGWTVTG